MEQIIVSENDMLEDVIKDDEPRDDFDSDFDFDWNHINTIRIYYKLFYILLFKIY